MAITAITANTGSPDIPTLEDTVAGLFRAAQRLPEDVEQTEYTPRNEVIFYDFIADRMTTHPTFGRTVYVQSRSWTKRYNGMDREESLKHIKNRIVRNRLELIEQLNCGMTASEMHRLDNDCYGAMSYSPAFQLLGDQSLRYRTEWRCLVMVFGGYAHPDAITDKQIDEFAITWPNYRSLADQGHEFFKRVCSVAPIADRIDSCIKDRREELLTVHLPDFLAREMGVIGSISHLLGAFSQEEILDALAGLDTNVDGQLLRAQAVHIGDIISRGNWSEIDHAGARSWIQTVLSKAKTCTPLPQADKEAAMLLKSAKHFGVFDCAVEIHPTAYYSFSSELIGVPVAIRLIQATEYGTRGAPLHKVEELLAKLDTDGVDYYLDEASKAFVTALGAEDKFPLLYKAQTYALGNSINEDLPIVRLT